jgi:hypothetical protein
VLTRLVIDGRAPQPNMGAGEHFSLPLQFCFFVGIA